MTFVAELEPRILWSHFDEILKIPRRSKDEGRMRDHVVAIATLPRDLSPWGMYLNADLVTFPSLYEGFGNALLESVYYKRLTVVNCYPVYNADIKPLGFEFIELDGFINSIAVENIIELLNDKEHTKAINEKNFEIAQEHFSLEVLEKKLTETLNQF